MSKGKHVDWKIIFHADETHPGQRFTCAVELRYPFRGEFLVFTKPEAFAVCALRVGVENRLVSGLGIPAVALHKQSRVLPVGVRGQLCMLEMLNIDVVPALFHAELHGKILISSEEETPVPTLFEGPAADKNLN